MKKPYLTISDRDRGAIFMRWKERFLIPDHRVQDICGASFAGKCMHLYSYTGIAVNIFVGFYYVCVDFNSSNSSKSCETMPITPENDQSDVAVQSVKQESPRRARRNSSTRRRGGRSPSASPRQISPVASMSGFYFHQNSEPYVVAFLLREIYLEHSVLCIVINSYRCRMSPSEQLLALNSVEFRSELLYQAVSLSNNNSLIWPDTLADLMNIP